MLIRQQTDKQGILTGIWKIEESEEILLSLFDNQDLLKQQIQHISNSTRRSEKLAVRALLKALTNEEKEINYFASGKPFLKDGSYNISISHTKGYATIALHPSLQVGIDIEALSDRILRIQNRFMSIKEREAIDKRHEPVVSLLYWSAKETAYKLLGHEGVDFSKELIISPFNIPDNELIIKEFCTNESKEFIINFEITDQYVLTVGMDKNLSVN